MLVYGERLDSLVDNAPVRSAEFGLPIDRIIEFKGDLRIHQGVAEVGVVKEHDIYNDRYQLKPGTYRVEFTTDLDLENWQFAYLYPTEELTKVGVGFQHTYFNQFHDKLWTIIQVSKSVDINENSIIGQGHIIDHAELWELRQYIRENE